MVKRRFPVAVILAITILAQCTVPRKVQQAPPVTVAPVIQNPVQEQTVSGEDAFFEELFREYPGAFDNILTNRKEWNVQIIYTQIDRDRNGLPTLTHHYFNKGNARYFYPASTVKFPVALLALEKSAAIQNRTGIDIRNLPMVMEAAYSGQTAVYNDPNTRSGSPAIAQYIRKIFLVSDNDAFNRLYEFTGQEYINDALHKKGYGDAQILHRLDVFLSDDENRHTNPVAFYDSSYRKVYDQPMLFNKKKYAARDERIGNAYYSNGKLIEKPMVFAGKNRIALNDLHTILQSLVFPQSVKAEQRFNITDADRMFVLKYMSQFPRESVYPYYDSSFSDGYAKALMYGNDKNPLPKSIRVFDKSGAAYGQLVDVAYIIDTEQKIEFMVSAAIYCNSDGVLNDDKYDYNTVGYPFLKNLGKALYNREAKRKKNFLPDLSSFIFTYDK
ncbi:serine hydrolase [Ferruginibacter sp. HRS2-29]|uniref:serine hydrolase n=1 Tax=Ferruginibacter sp. HRS2-29 TaxID=2487334 RepID=UPI0020CC3501|nr:serine hydrolase [Ferruginibacter sp. HRS2-29]MCP9753118.1 hypothetical protein [Ferruginibacter sp. HRS2-29]